MAEQQSSYRQIFKSTCVFGGVQVFNILVNIVKSKVIALWLGPEGIGLLGLYNSTLDVIKNVSGLGLNTSAVKDVSEANSSDNLERVSHTLTTLRRWVCLTGFLGFLFTLLFASQLSRWTFGNESYTWAFACLSVVLFLFAMNTGQLAALQGLRRISYLAKATVLGALAGLLFSIPLYIWMGNDGVVYALVVSAASSLFFSSFYARKIQIVKVDESVRQSVSQGWGMVKLGIALMLGTSAGLLATYLLKTYVARLGGTMDAGLFQSGLSITDGYFGLIFTAMAADYYPRLAAVNHDNAKVRGEVVRQAEIGVLIALPIIVLALFVMPLVIWILYSNQFLSSVDYVNWALVGNLFKVASWAVGYVILAKGKGKVFVLTEVLSNMLYLGLSVVGYRFYGIQGLGVSFCLYYFCHLLLVYFICQRLYEFSFSRSFARLFAVALILAGLSLAMQALPFLWAKVLFGVGLFSLTALFSWKQLNKRLNILQLINSKIKRS